MTNTNSLLDDDYLVHLPIVRGFLAGPIAIPINIMLDTGSTVNLITKKQVGRFMMIYNINESSVFLEVTANYAFTLNRQIDFQLFFMTHNAVRWR